MSLVPSPEPLRTAIETLYRTFSVYPLPRYTDPCLHCHSPADEAKLHAKPLRELTAEDLRDYAADALLTWGDVSVFKHFLPRLYDLYVSLPQADLEIYDPEPIFAKFKHADWRRWPREEQQAVEGFLRALWYEVLGGGGVWHGIDLESWLCAIAQAEDDLTPYWQEWLADSRCDACLSLATFLLTTEVTSSNKSERNPFWEERTQQYQQLQEWVRSKLVAEKLEQAGVRWSHTELKEQFEIARSMLV